MMVRPESSSSTRTSSGCSTSQETMYSSVSRDPISAGRRLLAGAGAGDGGRSGSLALDDAGDLEQAGHGLAGLSALPDPVERPRAVDLDVRRVAPRVVA